MAEMIFKIFLAITVVIFWIISKGIFFLHKSRKTTNKVLFLPAFFPGNAGYNWRVKEWANLLEKNGFRVDVEHAITGKEFYKYKENNRSLLLMIYLYRRFWQVIKSRKYEKVIVRRELLLYNDYGNLFLDKLLLKIHPNAILDFDDDIAYAKSEPREITSLYGKILQENGEKFTKSIKLYNFFMVGSSYLKNYALERNQNLTTKNIVVIPTCVNYENFDQKKYLLDKEVITFGWIGGNHNLFLVDTIITALNNVNKTNKIELLIIAGREYQNETAEFKIINKRWSLESEKEDIKLIDIGLMPLKNTNEDKGKAGFKLIQYMGMGVVSIASGITVNKEIVDDGINGFLVCNNEWEEVITKVIEKKALFQEISDKAREKITNNYSFKSNYKKISNFISKICVE